MNKIINFHAISDAAWFETVIVYLKRKYNMVGVKDLYDYYYNGKNLRNACLITVDDGHLSSFEVIYPILKKHNVPAIFFVSPKIACRDSITNFWFQEVRGYDMERLWQIGREFLNLKTPVRTEWIKEMNIDDIWKMIAYYQKFYHVQPKTPQNMTAEHIRQIDREGLVEIGAHTLTHPILANETDLRAEEEIRLSITRLEALLGHPVLTFAYPNGVPDANFGAREKRILKGTSVKLAFSTQPCNFHASDDVFAIPRYGLSTGSMNFIKLKLFLGKYYSPLRKLMRG